MNLTPLPPLIVISGPSGAGKSTLIGRTLARGGFRLAVSATTRAPREGEIHGRSYHFVDRPTFLRWRDEDRLLEWAEVHGEFYGTPRDEVLPRSGERVILDIDVQGFRSVRRAGLAVRGVFIAPPDLATLEQRLRQRRSEDEARLARRLANAAKEMAAMNEYDEVIVNDDLDGATRKLFTALGIDPSSTATETRRRG